eukprot:symbB.v1.2.030335.t1/scaffold3349.1/size58708/3
MVSDRSLRLLTRRRLLDGMVKHVLGGAGTFIGDRGSRESFKDARRRAYLVLIADKWTLQLLERVCQMHDLLSEGIALVECLDSPREALPLDALYFLAPSMENMDRLVEELSSRPKYRSSHVFFSHRLEDLMLQRVAQSYEAVCRISSFAELNVSTLCYDDRSFQLQDQGDALKQLLGIAPEASEGMEVGQIGSCLATFFASMGQELREPLVFCAGNRGCEKLAREVCQRLDEMEMRGGAMWRDKASPETCSLLIVDRSFDWTPLLLHDMGYEVPPPSFKGEKLRFVAWPLEMLGEDESSWLSTLPSLGAEPSSGTEAELQLPDFYSTEVTPGGVEDNAGRPSPETSPTTEPRRRSGKLPEIKPSERKVPGTGDAMKKWKATFQLTTAIKKGATLRGMVQLSQLGKVRAAEAANDMPVSSKALAARVSNASVSSSRRGSLTGPPKTAPGGPKMSMAQLAQRVSGPKPSTGDAVVPVPLFSLGNAGSSMKRNTAVQDIIAGSGKPKGADVENENESDGNFAAAYPSALARKMANVLQKMKQQGEEVSMDAALSRRVPKERNHEAPPRGELGQALEEGKLPAFSFKGAASRAMSKSAEDHSAISELAALPAEGERGATANPAASQERAARSQRRPSDAVRVGSAPGTGLIELELSARRRQSDKKQGSSMAASRPTIWQMSENVSTPSSPAAPRPAFKESASKWKALNLRKVKDTAPAESVGRRSSLELQPGLPQLAQTDGFSKWKGVNLHQLKNVSEGVIGHRASVDLQPAVMEEVRRTSVVPMPAVPVADPPSVMRLANALVEHFGSLSRGYEHFDFDKKGG